MIPADPNDDSTGFSATTPLRLEHGSLTNALISGDLGDSSYELTADMEVLELLRQVEQHRQAATLVVVNTRDPEHPQLVLSFNSNVFELDENAATMEFDLPMAAPPIARGLTLRGSVKLQGVTLTFEADVIDTRVSQKGRESALITSLPRRLYRLQRRDSFRVPVPNGTGLKIALSAELKHLQNLRVLDVSCGGVSLLLRTPPDDVRVGRRFPAGQVTVASADGSTTHEAEMIIRHARSAPPGLNHLVDDVISKGVVSPAAKFRESALLAVGAAKRPELMQLGVEFGRMPMSLDKTLSRLVNELALSLMTRVRDDA